MEKHAHQVQVLVGPRKTTQKGRFFMRDLPGLEENERRERIASAKAQEVLFGDPTSFSPISPQSTSTIQRLTINTASVNKGRKDPFSLSRSTCLYF